MKKNNWIALICAGLFHIAAIVIAFQNSERLQAPKIQEKPIFVKLQSSQHLDQAKLLAASEETSTAIRSGNQKNSGEIGSAVTEASSSPTEKFLLPPEEEPYLPAGEADIKPQPEVPVIVPFPDAPLGKPKGGAVLKLYIDSTGEIERVEVDRSDIPPLFEQAAIEAFMKAHMQPAIKNGKKVKATMKVFVEFEAK